jgi:hypothetical protein
MAKKPIQPSREAIDRVDREYPNASPAEKYRMAQAQTMVTEVEKSRQQKER